MMNEDKSYRYRFTIIGLIFIVLFTLIIFRLVSLMIVEGEHYRHRSESSILREISESAPRGDILAWTDKENGVSELLAGSKPRLDVQIFRSELTNEQIDTMIIELAEILRRNGDMEKSDFPIQVDDETGEFFFTFDRKIEQWRETYGITSNTAEEAFYEMLEIFNIEEEDPVEAQRALIEMPEVSLPISIVRWEFREEINKNRWLDNYRITDKDISAEDAYQYIRDELFNIPAWIDDERVNDILVLRDPIQNQGAFLQYMPITVAEGISTQSAIEIEEHTKLPGVAVHDNYQRYYPQENLASHVLGHVGRIARENEIAKFVDELGYDPSETIGKMGLEYEFEEALRGEPGKRVILVDSRGRKQSEIEEEKKERELGMNVYTSIDLHLQEYTENLLEEVIGKIQTGATYETPWGSTSFTNRNGNYPSNAKSGAAVVLDVNTGKVLAIASYPDFDPNLFTTGISAEDWQSLQPENPRDSLSPAPIRNIATVSAVQPGSAYKMAVGLGALHYGLDPNQRLSDTGFIEVGNNVTFGNWLWNQSRRRMPPQNLKEALAMSNNIYFGSLLRNFNYGANRPLNFSMSIDQLVEYNKQFGLGEKSGIEISEVSARLPTGDHKIIVTKGLLESRLKRDLREDHFTEEMLESNEYQELRYEAINGIVSVDLEDNIPTRGEVYAMLLNLGFRREYIDSGVESLGRISKGWADIIKYDYYNQAAWAEIDELNLAIGQGEHRYTPIQMANFTASIAAGKRHNISVIDGLEDPETGEYFPKGPEVANTFDESTLNHLQIIREGMHLMTINGSGSTHFSRFPFDVAGKTGTAQFTGKIQPPDEVEYLMEHLHRFGVSEADVLERKEKLLDLSHDEESEYYRRFATEASAMRQAIRDLRPGVNLDLDQFKEDYDNYAWFVGFAPYEEPEIAVAVVVHQGGSGGYAAPIFREIVAEYLGYNDLIEREESSEGEND